MAVALEGPGYVLNLVSVVLLVVAWISLILRIVVRVKIKAFGLDDWLMCLGGVLRHAFYFIKSSILTFRQVLFTIACASAILAAHNGVGALEIRLNEYYNKQARKVWKRVIIRS
jgi:uncharacterized BrkB/YihY/UPF0761 family membrane protein